VSNRSIYILGSTTSLHNNAPGRGKNIQRQLHSIIISTEGLAKEIKGAWPDKSLSFLLLFTA
jgi:hypothetical protein